MERREEFTKYWNDKIIFVIGQWSRTGTPELSFVISTVFIIINQLLWHNSWINDMKNLYECDKNIKLLCKYLLSQKLWKIKCIWVFWEFYQVGALFVLCIFIYECVSKCHCFTHTKLCYCALRIYLQIYY